MTMALTRLVSTTILAVAAFLSSGCSRYFFYPTKEYTTTPKDFDLSYEERRIKNNNALITAWFVPSETPRGVILFLHGNGNNMGDHFPAVGWLAARGYHLITFDYQGYGSSTGTPSIEGSLADVEAMLEAVGKWNETKNLPLFVFGQSIGGSFALYGAATTKHRGKLAGVIAESSFASYRKIVRDTAGSVWLLWPLQIPLSFTVSDRYSPLAHISRIAPLPLLLIHGTSDTIVPYRHAQLLFDAAASPKSLWTIENGEHTGALHAENERRQLLGWLDEKIRRYETPQLPTSMKSANMIRSSD